MLDQDERVELGELRQSPDFVSLHAPLAERGTRDLANASTLARMKPSAFLVNAARGGRVNECALADALRNGRLAGAALDVRASEPPREDDLLRDLPNVILTPHVAGITRESMWRVSLHVANDVLRALDRERPMSVVPSSTRTRNAQPALRTPIRMRSADRPWARVKEEVTAVASRGRGPRSERCLVGHGFSMAYEASRITGYRDACHWTGGNSRELIGS